MTAQEAAELDNDRRALEKCAKCCNVDCALAGCKAGKQDNKKAA